MEESRNFLEKLEITVNGGREFFEKSKTLPLEYVTEFVCPQLRGALDDIHLRIEERHKIEAPESEERRFVIHYTSIEALVSMLLVAAQKPNCELEKRESEEPKSNSKADRTKSAWRLYDSVHLNDPEEGSLLIRDLPRKHDWLLRNREESHAYIASFIMPDPEKKIDNLTDKLAFWCVYGMDGEGCSLLLQVPTNRLQKVLYGPIKVRHAVKLLKAVVDSLDPLVRIRNARIRNRVQEILARVVWEYLEGIRYLYKNEAYKHERECRYVVAESKILDKTKIRFKDQDRKVHPARIRHYYEPENMELGIETLLITGSSITLGPCVSHPYNVEYYLRALLRRANLEGPEIKQSKIPYRRF